MRRMMISLSAFVLACATSSPNQQSGTRRAQDDAQQQYQNAANAQKRATEEQQKSEQADRDVTTARKALADAQARRDAQHAKAAQAQREAARMGRDAQQRGAQMQEEATQLQSQEARQGAQQEQRASMRMRTVHGALAAVGRSDVTVRSDEQQDVRLEVNDSTVISLDGQTASISQIRAGSDVRASYGVLDGQTTAMRLDVTSRQPGDGTPTNGAAK